ncbi:MAG: hypothetical protein AVDCRST_MAG68-796 [uncultured Gemmatimonadetes bacterium]|uniref:Uncharacterized protein n=1 Tax=uncultured Gemmatimonadota bacterium TaxID=203437 RepID=A0A6J4KHY2_9BACT|nr:MAG: hypothetical protein AVDCRST_MAG68-796 [uncultured Gemmatimonadota bacterium]
MRVDASAASPVRAEKRPGPGRRAGALCHVHRALPDPPGRL